MPNSYLLGPFPCKALLEPGIGADFKEAKKATCNPKDALHYSLNQAGDQCLAQGDFDQSFLDALPAGYSVISIKDAQALRETWDK